MIESKHTWKGRMICRFFAGFRLNRVFSDIYLIGSGKKTKGSILMIANHFSWWDGFIQYRLNDEVYRKKYHVMMSEEKLLENKILNQFGAFSVRKQSRDVLVSLHYASSLLKDPDNMVLIFPQGRIESCHQSEIHFEKGVEYLVKKLPEKSQLVFNVNMIDFHADKKPSLYIYYRLFSLSELEEKETLEEKYNQYYRECREQQQAIWI